MSTIDTVRDYVTGTIDFGLNASYAMGAEQSIDWLPSEYTFESGRLLVEDAVDYDLGLLLAGKLPIAALDPERLYNTYTDLKECLASPGWLSVGDKWVTDHDYTIPTGAILYYTICLDPDLLAVWPQTQEELEATTIVLSADGTAVNTNKYEVTTDGLWWIADSYDDLPLDIYTGDSVSYSLAVTKVAVAEEQLNGVEVEDSSLDNPVQSSDGLELDILNTGADACDAVPKVINIFQAQSATVILKPYDMNGTVVPLGDTEVVARFTIRDSRDSRGVVETYDCEQVLDGNDEPTDAFTTTLCLTDPGVFVAQLILLNADLDKVIHVTEYYLSVAPVGFGGGPISISEVRFHLMDTCAQQNELLDALEYSDAAIINAVHSCIEFFNGCMGSSRTTRYTAVTFPADGRYFLKQGVCAMLLRSKAIQMTRNTLPYNAGGVSIDDQSKHPMYMQLAATLEADWRMYVGRVHSNNAFQRAFVVLN